MREPGYAPSTATEPSTRDDPTIPSYADPSITRTSQNKHKRRVKRYRAIARPDGIIVESPRYLPKVRSQRPIRRPEGNSAASNHTGASRKRTEGASLSDMAHDLLGVGMSVRIVSTKIMGSDGYTGFPERGRGGCNDEAAREHTPIHTEVNAHEQQSYDRLTPMARFLAERGSWGSFSFQDDPENHQGFDAASASPVPEDKAAGSDSAL